MSSYFKTPAMSRFFSGLLLLCAMSAGRCAEEDDVANAINAFSLDLFKEVARGTTGNMVVTPMSVAMVLTMLRLGARGNTASQLEEALYMDEILAMRTYGGLTRYYKHYFQDSATTISMANKMFLDASYSVNEDYAADIMSEFFSKIDRVNFRAKGSRHVINNWVDAVTQRKIRNLFNRDPNRNTQLVLINALYFQSQWEKPFNKNVTTKEKFYVNGSYEVLVPTMKAHAKVYYGECYDLKASWILLPFKDEDFSLMVALPNEKFGLNRLLRDLTNESVNLMINDNMEGLRQISLPRFKLQSSHHLIKSLKKLGVRDVFTSRSDLRGIATRPLKVSYIVQKTAFQIDEEGGLAVTVPAAITEPSRNTSGSPFKVDRPFLAGIVDMNNGVPLFLATVRNPRDRARH